MDFINPATLEVLCSGTVKSVEMKNPREIILTFAHILPEIVETNVVVENATWTAEVEIRGNYFSCIPTRGILVTTRKKVVIEENIFHHMGMSGILISNDANSWFESGRVEEVLIRNNDFIECGEPVINLWPENTEIELEKPVHRNTKIEGNKFQLEGSKIFYAKSSKGLQFINNTITKNNINETAKVEPAFRFLACSDVELYGNSFQDGIDKLALLE